MSLGAGYTAERPTTLGSTLTHLRLGAQLTQKEVAKMIGVTSATIGLIETGKTTRGRTLRAYCELMNVSSDTPALETQSFTDLDAKARELTKSVMQPTANTTRLKDLEHAVELFMSFQLVFPQAVTLNDPEVTLMADLRATLERLGYVKEDDHGM